jgi:hypothetical protein
MTRPFRLLLLLWICAPLWAIAQSKPLPINISLFNEATAIPFTKFLTLPLHPGIQVGTEIAYRTSAHSRLFQTANLSYYYHGQLNQGIALHTELGYEYRNRLGLALSALLGLGYMHTFATTKEYVFQDGQYLERTDFGNARLYPSLSLDVGYYLAPESVRSPKIFLRYQAWAEYPYSPGFIPVMTHINLHLGAKFFLPSTKTSHEKN